MHYAEIFTVAAKLEKKWCKSIWDFGASVDVDYHFKKVF